MNALILNGRLTDLGIYVVVIGGITAVVALVWGCVAIASRLSGKHLARVIVLLVLGAGLIYATVQIIDPPVKRVRIEVQR